MTRPGDRPEMAQDAALAYFSSRVAHDFNNLLTGILGNLELLQLRVERQNISGLGTYLDGANSAGARAAAFAARLMVYSGRTESPKLDILADAMLARFEDRATCQPGAPGAQLLCDPDQLELAIAELVENAREAGGEVFISSAATVESISIAVRDTGPGMAPEILARAHEPFFTTCNNATGRGLGLCIVGRVVRALGGTMAIDSPPDAGCTVKLVLPRS